MHTLFEISTWALLALHLVLVIWSWVAAIMAVRSLKGLRQRLAERSTRSLHQLDTQVLNLESTLSSMSTTLRRLQSRIGMQDLRARRKEESASTTKTEIPSNMEPAERKAWLRKQIAAGNMVVVKDPAP